MATTSPGQTSFNGGEISPRMFGRTDLSQYLNSVAILENFYCTPQGPALRRSGSRFVGQAISPEVAPKLLGFTFSTAVAYTLELGANTMRVFRDEQRILAPSVTFDSGDVDTATNSISSPGHFYADNIGPFQLTIGSGGTLPTPLVESRDYWIQRIDENSFGLRASQGGPPISLSAAGTGTGHTLDRNGNVPFEITTPWAAADLPNLDPAQSADVMYIAAGGVIPVHKIERRGDQDWTIREVKWDDGPYESENAVVGWKMNPTGTTGVVTINIPPDGFTHTNVNTTTNQITLTAHGLLNDTAIRFDELSGTAPTPLKDGETYYSIVIDANIIQVAYRPGGDAIDFTDAGTGPWEWQFPTFESEDVGRLIRWHDATNWHWLEITLVTDDLNVSALVQNPPLESATSTERWRLGSFSKNASVGHPATISFNDQRLILAGNPGGIQTLHASELGIFESFRPFDLAATDANGEVPVASDAFTYTIASNQVNEILWLRPVRSLLVGTSGGVWPMQSASTGEAITPSNVVVRQSSVQGTSNVSPLNVDDLVVYVSDTLRKIFAAGYTFEKDAFLSTDITTLAEHITAGGITQLAFAHEPHALVWAVRADGQLLSLTFDQAQRIQGWSRHILGGSFGSGDAVVESVSVVPATGGFDQVWIAVKRTVNGATVRHIEFIEQDFSDSDTMDDAYFVDSGPASYTGLASTGPFTVDHLIGETVTIVAGGAQVASQVVPSGGTVTLAIAATPVHIGLGFTSELISLPVAPTDPEGSSMGKVKSIVVAAVRFVKTVGAQIGCGALVDDVPFRVGGDPTDAAPPLFTGVKEVEIECGYDQDVQLTIRQALPYPMTVAAARVRVPSAER